MHIYLGEVKCCFVLPLSRWPSFRCFLRLPDATQTLRYANQGDLKSLDPYTLNEVTTLAHLGHVYEGLIARDKNLNIVPALAERWDTPEPTRWRFHLRRGVKFHNGDDFTAVASPAPDRAFGLLIATGCDAPHRTRHLGIPHVPFRV